MVTKSSREMQKDREKVRPPFGGLKFCQGTHYLPLTKKESLYSKYSSKQVKMQSNIFLAMIINHLLYNGSFLFHLIIYDTE